MRKQAKNSHLIPFQSSEGWKVEPTLKHQNLQFLHSPAEAVSRLPCYSRNKCVYSLIHKLFWTLYTGSYLTGSNYDHVLYAFRDVLHLLFETLWWRSHTIAGQWDQTHIKAFKNHRMTKDNQRWLTIMDFSPVENVSGWGVWGSYFIQSLFYIFRFPQHLVWLNLCCGSTKLKS